MAARLNLDRNQQQSQPLVQVLFSVELRGTPSPQLSQRFRSTPSPTQRIQPLLQSGNPLLQRGNIRYNSGYFDDSIDEEDDGY